MNIYLSPKQGNADELQQRWRVEMEVFKSASFPFLVLAFLGFVIGQKCQSYRSGNTVRRESVRMSERKKREREIN